MATRRTLPLVLVAVYASMGAAYPTTNFVVEAQTPQIAQQVAQMAEVYRREKAIEWLGYEMPPWPKKLPIRVHVTMSSPGGATSFAFDRGQVLDQHMHIEGPLDRLLASVLPHEVTHTVFAYYFRHPVPRWADEGGAVLSEDDLERTRHDQLVRQILNTPGRKIPLRRLFTLRDYPHDVMVLYAEGFSVSNYLVEKSNRQRFLAFIGQGMAGNDPRSWDYAVRSYYQYNSVEELEEAWLAHLRATKRQPVILAQNGSLPAPAEPTSRVVVRQTVPPAQPLQPSPVFRGQSPGADQDVQPAGAMARPGYLPDYVPATAPPAAAYGAGMSVPPDRWHPAGTAPYRPPQVQLGQPQFVGPGPAPVPPTASPAGYPR